MSTTTLLKFALRSALVGAIALSIFLLAPSSQSPTEAAPDYPGCSAFSTVTSYVDAYGNLVYQPVPVTGNPFTLYGQCVNNYCSFPMYGACVQSCPYATQQLFGFGYAVCPGPPASVLLAPRPDSVSCGSASNIELAVLDQNGLRVLDGTEVLFNTTLGYISTSNGTIKGLAHTSLTIPPKQSGVALITATAGGVSAQKLVQVTCP